MVVRGLPLRHSFPSAQGDAVGSVNGSGNVNIGTGTLVYAGTGTHTYNGVISGTGLFDLLGSALTCILNGTNLFTGSILISGPGQVLKINGYQPLSSVTVGSGDGYWGDPERSWPISASGSISPGNGPGILNSGNVIFSSSGNLTVELSGPNPGAGGYDQLNVTGAVSLASASLTVIPAFTTPVAIGQTFTIINNDLSDAISGTFNGLSNGSIVSAGGYKFVINYSGTLGNDVVLTLTNVPAAVIGSAITAGDGSHNVDPDGCNNLDLVITNTTGTPMTGITATLATTTPGIVIGGPASGYPDIAANGRGPNLAPFPNHRDAQLCLRRGYHLAVERKFQPRRVHDELRGTHRRDGRRGAL